MNKKTTADLENELRRILDDVNGTNYSDNLVIDAMNRAVEYTQQILVGAHRSGFIGVQWPFKRYDYENFSYKNQITLENDYDRWIEVRKFETEEKFEIVPFDKIYDDVTDSRAAIYASSISAPLSNSSNAGTDEFQVWGDFSGTSDLNYVVELTGATTFRWSDDGGSTWDGTPTITGDWQTLNNGVEVKFESTSGYTSGDKWTFTGYASRVCHILMLNENPTEDVLVTYARQQSAISTLGATTYLPFPNFYSLIRLICQIILRAWNDESVDVDAQINDIAVKHARDLIGSMNSGEKDSVAPLETWEDYL